MFETGDKASSTLQKIIELKERQEREIIIPMGRRSRQALALYHELFKSPVMTSKEVQAVTVLSPKAVNDLINVFLERGILRESTGYQRNRIFVFNEYVKLFL